jgi:serine phosphatase RsbU (regulator of sigma subunit)
MSNPVIGPCWIQTQSWTPANSSRKFFGQHGLRESLRRTAGLSPSAAADSIIASVRKWSAKQDDDLTLLVCDISIWGFPSYAGREQGH